MDIFDEILGKTSGLSDPYSIGQETYNYGDLLRCVELVSSALRSAGLEQGDRVEICFDVGFMFGVSLLSMASSGAVGVLFSPQWTVEECERVRRLSTPRFSLLPADRVMINDKSNIPSVIDGTGIGVIRHNVESDCCSLGDMMLIYTSGTSAVPKGVILTRDNLDANVRGINEYLQLSVSDRSVVFTPTAYAYAVSQSLTHAFAGSAIFPVRDGMSSPKSVIQAIEDHSVTGLAANPTAFKALLATQRISPSDLSTMRFVMSAGQFLEWNLVEDLEKHFPNAQVINTYGCTENSPRIAYLLLERGSLKEESPYVPVGFPVSGTNIRVIDSSYNTVPTGEVGEVAVSGRARMREYWQNDFANSERIVNEEFLTGDWGMIDENGRLHLVGRESNIIHVGHNKVSPEEVEAVLLSHPSVKDAGVFGEPDELREEVVSAKVVIYDHGDSSPDTLIRYCMEHLSRFKVPRAVKIVDAIPQTMYGKIDRTKLKDF